MKNFVGILLFMFICGYVSVSAQQRKQNGLVRKITRSSIDKMEPVEGVRVTIGNISRKSNAQGRFTHVILPDKRNMFRIKAIDMPKNSGYVLYSPKLNSDIEATKNDILVIVRDVKEEKEFINSVVYNSKRSLLKKQKQLNDSISNMRMVLLDMKDDSKMRKLYQERCDSLQKLVDRMNSPEAIIEMNKRMREDAEKLAQADYISLDEKSRAMYDLKRKGDWKGVIDVIMNGMNNNPIGKYRKLKQGYSNTKEAISALQVTQKSYENKLDRYFKDIEDLISGYKHEFKNDSVSKYYAFLINEKPDNIDYLSEALEFERIANANFDLAIKYCNMLMDVCTNDTLLAACKNELGMNYLGKGYNDKAELMLLDAHINFLNIFGKNHLTVGVNYVSMGTLYISTGRQMEAISQFEKALNIYKRYYKESSNEIRSIYMQLSAVYQMLEDYDNALKYLNMAIDAADISDNRSMITTYMCKGQLYMYMGRYKESSKYLSMALDMSQKLFGDMHVMTAGIYSTMAYNSFLLADIDKAQEYCNRAMKIWDSKLDVKNMLFAICYLTKGKLHEGLSEFDEALDCYLQAYEINKSLFDEDSKDMCLVYLYLGQVMFQKGSYDDAIDFFLKVIKIRESLKQYDHIDVGRCLTYIGRFLILSTEFDSAEEALTKSLEILRQKLPAINPEICSELSILANLYVMKEEFGKAKEYALGALEMGKKLYGDDNPFIAEAELAYALSEYGQGNTTKAMELLDETLELVRKHFGDDNYLIYQCFYHKGLILSSLEDTDNAIIYFEKSLAVAENLFDGFHIIKLSCHSILGSLYTDKHQLNEALKHYEDSYRLLESKVGKDNPSTLEIIKKIDMIKGLIIEEKADKK